MLPSSVSVVALIQSLVAAVDGAAKKPKAS